MATTTSSSVSSFLPIIRFSPNPKTRHFLLLHTHHNSSPPPILVGIGSPLSPPPPAAAVSSSKIRTALVFQSLKHRNAQKRTQFWRISATSGDALPSDAATPALETAQEIMAASDGGSASVIQILLFIAFLGLSILTVGVVYIAVTDFLQKREKEKFEKEEAEKKKKKTKKSGRRRRPKVRPKARGFGQKIEEDDYDDDDDS